MENVRPSWKRMMELRKEVRRRFPDPLALPLVKRPEDLIARFLPEGARLLDVGAGDRALEGKLRRRGLDHSYASVEPEGEADWSSLDDAGTGFDACALLEVVEHLTPDEGFDLVRRTADHLKKAGILFLSTPNVFKPGQFFRDATHRTAYAWEELGALCIAGGFELEGLYRVYNAPALSRFLHLVLLWPLHRFLGLDCARSVMAVARK